MAAICMDDRIENEKKYIIEVYDTEQRVKIAMPPTNISSHAKTCIDRSPRENDRPILAVSGVNESS